jgi:hypothetical protein
MFNFNENSSIFWGKNSLNFNENSADYTEIRQIVIKILEILMEHLTIFPNITYSNWCFTLSFIFLKLRKVSNLLYIYTLYDSFFFIFVFALMKGFRREV